MAGWATTLSRRNSKISLSLFPRYIAKCHQIYNLVGLKDSIEQNKSSSLEIKCRIGRIEVDYSSWNLIHWKAVKKSNLPFLWNLKFSNGYFVCLVHVSSLLSLLVMFFFSNFKIKKVGLKPAPGHDHEHTIFQTGQWPFKLGVMNFALYRRILQCCRFFQVAILIDTSGSMVSSMDELKRELAALVWDQIRHQATK